MVFEAIFSGTILCSAPSWRTGIRSRMGTESYVLPLLAQRGFIQRYNSFFLFRALNFYRKWRSVGHHCPPNACVWSLKFVKITVTCHMTIVSWQEMTKIFLSYVSGGIEKWEPWLLGWNYKMWYPGPPWGCALYEKSLPHSENWSEHSWYPPLKHKQPGDDKVSNTVGEGLFKIVSHRFDQWRMRSCSTSWGQHDCRS